MKTNNSIRIEVLKAMKENTRSLYDTMDQISEKDRGYMEGLQMAIWILEDRKYLEEMTNIFMK